MCNYLTKTLVRFVCTGPLTHPTTMRALGLSHIIGVGFGAAQVQIEEKWTALAHFFLGFFCEAAEAPDFLSCLASFLVTFFSSLETLVAGLFFPNGLAGTETLACFLTAGLVSGFFEAGFIVAYFFDDAPDDDECAGLTSFLGLS